MGYLKSSAIYYYIVDTLYSSKGIFWPNISDIGTSTRTLREIQQNEMAKWVIQFGEILF